MYAQYQNFQPQPNRAASQQGLTWNGSAWVPLPVSSSASTAVLVQSSTYSTYEQPVKPSIPDNPVVAYTQYYHGWQAHGKECEEELRQVPTGNTTERTEVQRRVDWAKYYGDNSSRAAHHFYQNPKAISAPFDLPPAPPATRSSILVVAPATSTSTSTKSSSDEQTPGGLTRYVKRCLDRGSTAEQKKSVQVQLETVIANAIQQGNLHSKNWDLVPLISVPEGAIIQMNQQAVGNGNYYGSGGPSNRHNQINNKYGYTNKRNDSMLPESQNYYGYGGGATTTTTTIPSPANNSKRHSNLNEGYYGPASSSSSPPPVSSSYYSNPSSFGDSSSFSSQKKRVVSPEDDYIAVQHQHKHTHNHQHKQKKQKKKDSKGFEKTSHVLAKRASRFSGQGRSSMDASNTNTGTTIDGHEKYMGKRTIGGSQKVLDERDFEQMTVKGTCQSLPKEYLRLTAPPRAELVRPQPVLERHVANLKQDYAAKRRDYSWFCSQLKALRQDCTVQRIQNAFAVDVYETHAQIALQEGDLNEYNQCQTQLKELYHETKEAGIMQNNANEFVAYRLLYHVFLTTNETYDGGSSDMFKIMLSLTVSDDERNGQDPAIAHALQVREAVAASDYLQFFRLHKRSPNLGRYLTERMVPTMRMRGLRRLVKAYRPLLEIEFCLRQIGFEASSVEEGKEWLTTCGCVLEGPDVVTKDTTVHEPDVDKKNSLI
jgi:hypothetical protein